MKKCPARWPKGYFFLTEAFLFGALFLVFFTFAVRKGVSFNTSCLTPWMRLVTSGLAWPGFFFLEKNTIENSTMNATIIDPMLSSSFMFGEYVSRPESGFGVLFWFP